ncbi:hypothetical protein J6TS1_51640 [Siminovitchia terrae]|uniref:YfhD family protein n=1 Tax=Siminovitchia terrae TaxID=1914933 RepID=A0ABQ4L5V8_SIMTE|nr:hypothetical protein J6TS1_51640 [Siminovitchia terrae]
MGRSQNQKTRDKNKQKLPQVPKQLKSDGRDIEFSRELADQEDLKALARSEAADKRAKRVCQIKCVSTLYSMYFKTLSFSSS